MAIPIIMPRQGQSVESCILVQWLVKPGDSVSEGQPVANIETDKATFEVPAPASGTVLELFFSEGADIPVLTNIGAIGSPGEDVAALRPGGATAPPAASASPTPEPEPTAQVAPSSGSPSATPSLQQGTPVGVSPRARKAAEKAGIDPTSLAGSGPNGRVIERDIVAAAAGRPPMTVAARAAGPIPAGAWPAQGTGVGGRVTTSDRLAAKEAPAQISRAMEKPAATVRELPVKGIRKIIAERMRQSLSTTAQLTLHARADITVLQAFRARAKAKGEAFGFPKVTINDLVCFAAVRALKKHPALNAHFLGDRILEFESVHLGVAVDTPRGLMVPVVQDADRLSLAELSAAIRERADACQSGSINPDLLVGGTFTVTNLGALGIDYFTPVLNAPEVAILGVGGISLQPARRADGSTAFVETLAFSLTIDHQAVDGAPAARFLQDLVTAVEHIDILLAADSQKA